MYSSSKNGDHMSQLQSDLTKLQAWQDRWLMEFNVSKCYIMRITNKKEPPTSTFSFCGQVLQEVTSHPYLGVELDSKLRNKIINKANKTLGFLRRNLWYCTEEVKTTAYEALVRPILEYSSVVWDPYYEKDIQKVEMIQRRAARFCVNDYGQQSSVTKMLAELEWDTLQTRRSNSRLHMMYKITNDLVGINKHLYITPAVDSRSRHSHSKKLQELSCNTNVYKYSYFPRTIREWNNLTNNNVTSISLEAFKKNINSN